MLFGWVGLSVWGFLWIPVPAVKFVIILVTLRNVLGRMSNPVVRAFFVGKAVADVLRERWESTLTDIAGEVGKAWAELQEGWHTFAEDVMARAEAEATVTAREITPPPFKTDDLQATLDDLRAEVAQLRSELQKYRSQNA